MSEQPTDGARKKERKVLPTMTMTTSTHKFVLLFLFAFRSLCTFSAAPQGDSGRLVGCTAQVVDTCARTLLQNRRINEMWNWLFLCHKNRHQQHRPASDAKFHYYYIIIECWVRWAAAVATMELIYYAAHSILNGQHTHTRTHSAKSIFSRLMKLKSVHNVLWFHIIRCPVAE